MVTGWIGGSNRFELAGLLGRGSMGLVYRAFDRELDRTVALKMLPLPTKDGIQNLKREFRAAADLAHPNVISLYDLFVDPSCFFTMELLHGDDFLTHVCRRGAGSRAARAQAVLRLLPPLVSGLEAIHGSGLLHRDVKPSNVIVESRSDVERPVLLDLGLTVPLRPIRSTEETAGTFPYMPPEQIWGQPLSPASDLFALGAMLFEALEGRTPYSGADMDARSRPPAALPTEPGVPDTLFETVVSLLSPDPMERPGIAEIRRRLSSSWPGDGDEPALPKLRAVVPSIFGETIDEAFVGRTEALRDLRRELEAARREKSSVVHVTGPSGIGKTALLRRFVAEAREAGALTLTGRCHPRESLPYKALDSVIEDLGSEISEETFSGWSQITPEEWQGLCQIFPALMATPQHEPTDTTTDAQTLRRRGAAGLGKMLARLASTRPVVIWIDDVQWGDQDSAFVVEEILREAVQGLMVVLSYRNQASLPPGFASLGGDRSVHGTSWTLQPLTEEEARRLAEVLLGPERAELDLISRECNGSPFLLGELARFATSAPLDELPADAGSMLLGSLVERRLARMDSAERRVLEVVSLAAGPIARDLLIDLAGPSTDGAAILTQLEKQCLLSSTGTDSPATVQVYHDRIGETMAELLPPERQAAIHGSLASSLERRPDAEPEALAVHCLAAGRREDAGRYAKTAADRAAAALAFSRAAELYQVALENAPEGFDTAELHVSIAEALSNAGQGALAGARFEEAADVWAKAGRPRLDVIRLRRRGAEELVKCGEIEEGLSRTRDVLAMLDLRMPETPAEGVRRFLHHRVRLLLRGTKARADDRVVDPLERARIDALWAASVSVGLLNPTLSSSLSVQHLYSALDLGDDSRLCLALGNEAAWRAVIGSFGQDARALSILDEADTLAARTGDPYDHAWSAMARGIVHWGRGGWKDAVVPLRTALDGYRERCSGSFFEAGITNIYLLSSLSLGGQIEELSGRVRHEYRDALHRGDHFGANGALLGESVLGWLREETADEIVPRYDDAIARWSSDGFLIQHYHHLVGVTQALLHAGRAEEAATRMEEAWPQLRAAGFLLLRVPRAELIALRGRVALAASRSDVRLRRTAKWASRRLVRAPLGLGGAFGAAIEAGLALLDGDRTRAGARYLDAANRFEHAEMPLHQQAALWNAGPLGYPGEAEGAGEWLALRGFPEPDDIARACLGMAPAG